MAFQTPITIYAALGSIHKGEYVLPAIQREFVWPTEKIERLFDSLMRGYPIGSFLFWRIEQERASDYKYFDFMRKYHQLTHARLEPTGPVQQGQITAVLDGQQRLTALNIGLKGSYAKKLPHKPFSKPGSYAKRRLYLNLVERARDNDRGMHYDFRFLTKKEVNEQDSKQDWYRVDEVMKVRDIEHLVDSMPDKGDLLYGPAFKTLLKLRQVVHDAPVIAYYEEQHQDLDRVLDIFIRANSGGKQLTHSDILMSIATAQWETLDAREEIHGTVDELNHGGRFAFSSDFLLKAGLMLAGVPDVRFKVTNFNRNNMQMLEKKWGGITSAVRVAVELVADFGFSRESLTAHNAVLPIAHYLYRRGAPIGFLGSEKDRADRDAIRRWLTRSLIKKGIWGSGLDTLLIALRRTIDKHGESSFPTPRIEGEMRGRGKSLRFEDEDLADLAESSRNPFALLSLLNRDLNLMTVAFDIDHIFPKSRFTAARLRKAGVPEQDIRDFRDRVNRLPNLQLLSHSRNLTKGDKLPRDWLMTMDRQRRTDIVRRNDLGTVPADIKDFMTFYNARRDLLKARLRNILVSRKSSEEAAE